MKTVRGCKPISWRKPYAAIVTFILANCAAAAHPHALQQRPQPEGKPQIRVEVDLVQDNVTVTDAYGRIVTGLKKSDFHLYEDGIEQEITNFSEEDVPVSIALVLDVSGSIGQKMPIIRTGAVEFLRNGNPRDEFMAVGFRNSPLLLSPFTSDPDTLESNMLYLTSHGMTALYDGVYLALQQMHTAHNGRRAIILISDGGENHSRYNEKQILRVFEEADTQFYAIGVFGGGATPEEAFGPTLLKELADRSGGRFFSGGPNRIPDIVQRIGDELRTQYVLAFHPANHPHDGRWHKLQVKLDVPRGLPPLNVYARTGYTSPKN